MKVKHNWALLDWKVIWLFELGSAEIA